MRSIQVLRPPTRVHCSMCHAPLFTIKDTRFGLPPAAVLCRTCTLGGFRQNNDVIR